MRHTIQFKESALRALESLDKPIRMRIARRIEALANEPRPADVKVLKGSDRDVRIWVGDHRIVYRVDGKKNSTTEARRMPTETVAHTDVDSLQQLNRDYIRSVQASDVRRFDEILAEDFLCSNPDGSLVDRAGFLAQTARPVAISNLEAHEVRIRIMGDVALVHARTTYTLPDGRAGSGRYTDVWARRQGRWLAVSAHVTRC